MRCRCREGLGFMSYDYEYQGVEFAALGFKVLGLRSTA